MRIDPKIHAMKPRIVIDFDGVIHSYASGWKGADVIPDEPVEGAIAFLLEALQHFNVAIHSSRSDTPEGRAAMRRWLHQRVQDQTLGNPEIMANIGLIEFPEHKLPALLTIDDRCFCFEGRWPTIRWIKDFRSWVQK